MRIFNEVIDITHHSKRTQAGNLIQAGVLNMSRATEESHSSEENTSVPTSVTLESAIRFYKDNAVGQFENLFKFTSEILERYRKLDKKDRCPANQESDEEIPEYKAEE